MLWCNNLLLVTCLGKIQICRIKFTKLQNCESSLYKPAFPFQSSAFTYIWMKVNGMKSVVWPAFYWVILVKTSTLFSYFLTVTSTSICFRKCTWSYSFSSDFSFDCMLWSFWQACCLAGQNTWQIFLQEAIWILQPTVSVQNTSVGSHGNGDGVCRVLSVLCKYRPPTVRFILHASKQGMVARIGSS